MTPRELWPEAVCEELRPILGRFLDEGRTEGAEMME